MPAWLITTAAPPDLTSPRRSPPGFGCTCTERVVDPSPDASDNVNHGTVEDACHRHPDGVLRRMLATPPGASIGSDCAESSTLHGTPSCLSSTRCSLTVTTAVLDWPTVFARTVTLTVAAPWPDVGLRLSQEALLAAVHSHSRAASTLMEAVPPPCTNVDTVELTPVWHRVLDGASTAVSVVAPPQPKPAITEAVRRTKTPRAATAARCARLRPRSSPARSPDAASVQRCYDCLTNVRARSSSGRGVSASRAISRSFR